MSSKAGYRGFMGWLLLTLVCAPGCISHPSNAPIQQRQWGPVLQGVQLSASLGNSLVAAGDTILLTIQIRNSSPNQIAVDVDYWKNREKPFVSAYLSSVAGNIIDITQTRGATTWPPPPISIDAGETKQWELAVDIKSGIERGDYIVIVSGKGETPCCGPGSLISWLISQTPMDNQAANLTWDWRAFCQLSGVSWPTSWLVVRGRRSSTSLR